MSRRWTSRRQIAVYVALLLLAAAGACFVSLHLSRAHFWHDQRFNCLAALSVDLSAPGTYTASIRHWTAIHHHAILGLDVPRTVLEETSPGELLDGLQGTYSIRDEGGTRIFWGSLVEDPNDVSLCESPAIIQLHRFDPRYRIANWQVDVIVTNGAARLKGVPQRLVLVDRWFTFLDMRKVVMWFSLIVAVLILMGVEGSRYQAKLRLKNDKKPAEGD